MVTFTLAIVGLTLVQASHRYRICQQSARWSQAGQAAEAGAEVALMSAQKGSWAADGWSGVPGAPGASPVTKTLVLAPHGPARGEISASVAVDTLTMGGEPWLRIRSTGMASVSGGAAPGNDPRDVMLRKLSLRTDRNTGSAVTVPMATRTVEIMAQPVGKSAFRKAVQLQQAITMSGGGSIDSFDSSDPTKSTNSLYDVAKRQSNATVGVLDSQGISNLNGTFVYGDLAYGGPTILNTQNVKGTLSNPYTETANAVAAPTWTTMNATPTIINQTTTLTGGPKSSPARYKFSSVTVLSGRVLTLAPHASGAESYVEIWITGSLATMGTGSILQRAGVHATYHIAGNVSVLGNSFCIESNVAANNMINLITPPSGTNQKVDVLGSGVFIGVLNAPGADFTISGTSNFSGALIGKTMNIQQGASLHYDEALSKMSGTGVYGYKVRSLVEAVR